MIRRIYVGSVAALFLMLIFGVPVSALATVDIFPPDSEPYGLSYDDHIKNFWKWLISIPAEQNPSIDPTGDKCNNGQSNSNSSVFYLSKNTGGKSERTCVLPAGKGLLIPVMQVEWSDKETPGAAIQDLHDAATKDQDGVNSLYLEIDGTVYNYDDLIKYRTHTDDFEVVFPDKGIFGILEGGPARAVADGFYILTEPLSLGNHTVHFKSSLVCPDPGCAEPSFAQDIKYNLYAK